MAAERIQALTIPKLGMTMKEGKVTRWHVPEGAALKAGDPVFDVETEKITQECEAPAAGVLRRQVAREGEVLPVGALVGAIADAQVPQDEIDRFVTGFAPVQEA
jgi:pyruvate/2-oxoglutarate dehydrogenase complex dihydrolipoamide acyltransferase (E2) component